MKPKTLIQIHYHNRIGGVTQVMGYYARAFEQMHNGRSHRLLTVCNAAGSVKIGTSQMISMPTFDYQTYRSLKSLHKDSEVIRSLLFDIITDSGNPGPVAIVGHNLSLAKNCALSMAFASCARQLDSKKRYRFISVIHDRAEEGRFEQLKQIHILEKSGVRIMDDLYPRTRNLRFAVLNGGAFRDLAGMGLDPTLIINPVDRIKTSRITAVERLEITRGLAGLARLDGTMFEAENESICYPARITSRKNIVEAILAVCILGKKNLLLGACGASANDRSLYNRLILFCRSTRLPVVFDCGRLGGAMGKGNSQSQLFSKLVLFSTSAISTSILEGFGYVLFEPWLLNRQVYGRTPDNFVAPPGMDFSSFYDRCTVPVSWINQKRMNSCFNRFFKAPMPYDKNSVDFADLDIREQLRMVKKMILSPELVKVVKFIFGDSSCSDPFQKKPDVSLNRSYVEKHLSFDSFSRQFHSLLEQKKRMSGRLKVSKPSSVSGKINVSRLLLAE